MLSSFDRIVCAKCNGRGYNNHYNDNSMWSEICVACNGKGMIKDIIVDDIVIDDEILCIPKKEYEELLEYKNMYEKLCT